MLGSFSELYCLKKPRSFLAYSLCCFCYRRMFAVKKEPDVFAGQGLFSCVNEMAGKLPLQCHFDNKFGHLSVGSRGCYAALLQIGLFGKFGLVCWQEEGT